MTEKPAQHYKPWSNREKRYLEFHWGERAPHAIAAALGRTVVSVIERSHILNLGRASQGTKTLVEVSRYSGFSEEKIMNAVGALNLNIAWAFSSTAKKRKINQRAFTDEQVEKLIEYMLEHERVFPDKPGRIYTTKGKWGVGKKPVCCVKCGKTDMPHHAKGKCMRCYRSRPKTYPAYVPSGNPRGGGKRLSDAQVLEIRTKRWKGASYNALATEYGVTRPAISKITKGRFRKDVGGPVEPYESIE